MFDFAWSEMLVIAIVLIVVVGPKDLPKMLRTFGRMMSKMTSMAGDFRKQFDEALREAELDDVKGTIDSARKLNPVGEIRKALNPLEKAAQDVRSGLDQMSKPKPADPASAQAASPNATPVPSEPLKAGPTAMPLAEKAPPVGAATAPAKAAAKVTSTPEAKPVAAAKSGVKAAATAKAPAPAKVATAKAAAPVKAAPARATPAKPAPAKAAAAKSAAAPRTAAAKKNKATS